MIGWLHDRPSVMYPAIVAWIVCCTLYRCGLPNSIAGSKVGLLPKTWDLRAIGARDKLAVSPRRRRWANPPPRKPNLTQHPQLFA